MNYKCPRKGCEQRRDKISAEWERDPSCTGQEKWSEAEAGGGEKAGAQVGENEV